MAQIVNIFIFILLVFLIILLSFYEKKFRKGLRETLFLFLFVFTVIFLTFRSIGLDLEPYRKLYETFQPIPLGSLIGDGLFSKEIEPVFSLMISTLKKLNMPFQSFLFLSSLIPMAIICYIILKKEQKHATMAFSIFLCIYFLKGPVDIVRHFFAATIYLSSLYSLSNYHIKTFWLKSFTSVLAHYSNLAVIITSPLLKIKWDLNKYLVSGCIAVLFGLFSKYLISIQYFDWLLNSSNVFLWNIGYYLTYYNAEGYSYINTAHKVLSILIDFFPIFLNLLISILSLTIFKKIFEDNFYSLLVKSLLVGSILSIFLITVGAQAFAVRLNFLYGIGNFLVITYMLNSVLVKAKTYYYSLTLFTLTVYNFLIILYFSGVHDPSSRFFLF